MKKKKSIDKMNPSEICEYLNTYPHRLPIIMKHAGGYDFYDRFITLKDLTLKQAYKQMKNAN